MKDTLRGLIRRVDRLQVAAAPDVCNCPGVGAIVFEPAIFPHQMDASEAPEGPCEQCGGAIRIFHVKYVEDWRGAQSE